MLNGLYAHMYIPLTYYSTILGTRTQEPASSVQRAAVDADDRPVGRSVGH